MAKKKVKQITRVALVVDRSGSMRSILEAARSGLFEQLNTIKNNADKSDETYLTLISFDNEITTHFDGVNIKKLKEVDINKVIDPRGTTAMNDAVMTAIDLLKKKRDTSGTAYLIIVISDGWENASKTPTYKLSERIKELEGTGKWTFTYMLSNNDIHKVAKDLNLDMGNVAAFEYTSAGTKDAFATMAMSTGTYFSSRAAGQLRTSNFYNTSDSENKTTSK